MSYTVLARKWRPKNFAELVGQSHVMQALSNALDQQRLHHAYLFTGTRGVGKTTIARIFAKALNCQQGISSTPCGVCETCRSIDEGRFIDLIEVDAASKTKVDDTREILDNVQFAPTQGRYKVYLIDEVHMLSKSSFNALLKTLEEPPEHVKFLLATTDPHKLPITVLSRCLQFNLMRLTQLQIQNHLAHILVQENIPFEDAALALIAKSADGSARDSLSLLDQSIAYGAGEVMFEPVQTMLGLVDQQFGVAILQALSNNDAQQVKNVIQQLATMGVDYQALLAQLIESLHAISYVQVFADNETTTLLPAEIVKGFAESFTPERVQLLYQIALLTKQDMQLAPDIRIGFEMALMRMLAFQPAQAGIGENQSAQTVLNQVSQSQPVQAITESVEAEPSPMDALAGLATARSLVGKKNTSITPEADSLVNANQNEAVSMSSEEFATEDSEYSQGPVLVGENLKTSTSYAVNEPAIEGGYNNQDSPQQIHNEHISAEQISAENPVENSYQAQPDNTNETPVVTDHLAQIRERLKQPFAKPMTSSATAILDKDSAEDELSNTVDSFSQAVTVQSSQSNDVVSKPSEQLNRLQNQALVQTPEYFAEPDLSEMDAQEAQQTTPVFDDLPPWHIEESLQNVSLSEKSQLESVVIEPSAGESIQESNKQGSGSQALIEIAPTLSNSSQSTPVIAEVLTELEKVDNEDFISSGNQLQDWMSIIKRLDLKGMSEDLARNSVLVELTDTVLRISIDPEQQYAKPEMVLEQIEIAVKQFFGSQMVFEVVVAHEHFTPVKYEQKLALDKQQAAQQAIAEDGAVNSFIAQLGMEVIPGTLKPI